MRMQLVGLKHLKGVSNKSGKPYDFWNAMLVSEMSQRDLDAGAKGMDVHTPTVPDRYMDLLCIGNIGKFFDVETYFNRGSECIGYAALADEQPKKPDK